MSNNVFYDAKRPAANGNWVAIHRGKVIVEHTTHKTEEEAAHRARALGDPCRCLTRAPGASTTTRN